MKRLRKELKKLREPVKPADIAKAAAVDKFAEVSVGDDMTKWTVLLKGPDGVDPQLPFAPYAGATFTVEIQFPSEYPFKAPKVRFDTPIFHPNGESASVDGPYTPHHLSNLRRTPCVSCSQYRPPACTLPLPQLANRIQTWRERFAPRSSRRGGARPSTHRTSSRRCTGCCSRRIQVSGAGCGD